MHRTCFAIGFFLIGSSLAAQAPIKAPNSLPFYKLSNIRIEDDNFGRPNVVCGYQLTREGDEHYRVQIAGRTESGKLDLMGFSGLWDKDSGEIRISKMMGGFGRNRSYNYELYLVTHINWAGKTYGPFMISNSVRIGNPGPTTKPRELNAKELDARKKHELDSTPPEFDPPAGYEFADLTTDLIPGMFVVTGRYGEWEKAEFLGFTKDHEAKLRFKGSNKFVVKPVEGWVAVDSDVLAKGKASPESFRPSGQTIEGVNVILPKNAIPLLQNNVNVVLGTPLLRESAGRWREVVVTELHGSELNVRDIDGSFSRKTPVSKLAIKESVAEQLSGPNAGELFAKNLIGGDDMDLGVAEDDEFESQMEDAMNAFADNDDSPEMQEHLERARNMMRKARSRAKDYPIESPIPKNCVIVPKDLKIPKGTKVAACFHFDWSPATVVSDFGDTLSIDWDDHNSAWNCRISKSQMIIQKRSVSKIKKDTAITTAQLADMTRVWTDSTGQHKVKANFVSKTKTEVTLRLEDGFEKTLPIAKLSEKDRELLKNVKAASKNPFAK
ncbi:MAG: SHD1 domain-containing protein [Planctomycetota bacterium]